MGRHKLVGLVLTYNEQVNIQKCLDSLKFCDAFIVFDSESTDDTLQIAKNNNAITFVRKFDNYAAQRNAALQVVGEEYEWVLMIDADETISPELKDEILKEIELKDNPCTMYRVRRKDYFMGKWIRRSSGYPTWFPRLFRNGKVTVERAINEEYNTNGVIANLRSHLNHYPFSKGLAWWIERHNRYSSMEAKSLSVEFKHAIPWKLALSKDPVERRKFQKQFIYRLPGRPFIVFFALYVVRKGFLDGVAGLRFCKLRMMYETMIDLKLKELKYIKR
jgi:glycosyltransferase involved in cell wall biosynthesis